MYQGFHSKEEKGYMRRRAEGPSGISSVPPVPSPPLSVVLSSDGSPWTEDNIRKVSTSKDPVPTRTLPQLNTHLGVVGYNREGLLGP